MNENNQTHQSLVIDNYSNELFTVDKHSAEVIVKPEGRAYYLTMISTTNACCYKTEHINCNRNSGCKDANKLIDSLIDTLKTK